MGVDQSEVGVFGVDVELVPAAGVGTNIGVSPGDLAIGSRKYRGVSVSVDLDSAVGPVASALGGAAFVPGALIGILNFAAKWKDEDFRDILIVRLKMTKL